MTDPYERLRDRAKEAGFEQSSTPAVGGLLSALAASKPRGRFLELGTGIGLGTLSILAGMSATAELTSVELDPDLSAIAQQEIEDQRVEFIVADGAIWLEQQSSARGSFDLVFADTWPGKFSHLDEALALVATGGIYLVDDLSPQPTWPPGHQPKVDALVGRLSALQGWTTARLHDASGIMICTRLS